jgi:hypothetical protein
VSAETAEADTLPDVLSRDIVRAFADSLGLGHDDSMIVVVFRLAADDTGDMEGCVLARGATADIANTTLTGLHRAVGGEPEPAPTPEA